MTHTTSCIVWCVRVCRWQVRFAQHVFPGETLETQVWVVSSSQVVFQSRVVERDAVVLKGGGMTFRDGALKAPLSEQQQQQQQSHGSDSHQAATPKPASQRAPVSDSGPGSMAGSATASAESRLPPSKL